jgi:transposase
MCVPHKKSSKNQRQALKILDISGFLSYNYGMKKLLASPVYKTENDFLKAEISRLKGENDRLNHENTELKLTINRLTEQFRLAQHRRFGASSEKNVLPGQLGLFDEAETLADANAPEPSLEEVLIPAHKRAKKTKGKREELYGNIPTEQIIHELPNNERICPDCGKPLHACKQDILRRELEIIPAKIRAIEHIQVVYGCRECEKNAAGDPPPMLKSEAPAPVVANSGLASPSLVSFIMCNKYVLALPLYRQEQELERLGIKIPRQTMANWIIYAATRWLEPIYRLLHDELLKNYILHADETSLQVIKEANKTAAQKPWMWMYHTGRDAERHVALFEYQPTREGSHPLAFLAGWNCGESRFLHVDGYAGYKDLENKGVTLVERWAHARRKFHDVIKVLRKHERANTKAIIGLDFCDRLFALERKFDEENLTPDERKLRRECESKPIADAFFEWAESMRGHVLSKNKLAEAIAYAINQKKWLLNFLRDGQLELSNNRAERSIRPFTVGRKNWLFSYCAKGAKASATVYSIIETAQANGLVPFKYLEYLFQTLPNIPAGQFHACLPWEPAVQEVCKIPNL